MNFQSPHIETLQTDFTVVPPQTEVVIAGGGIVGACTALFLARMGVPVCWAKRGALGEEQSSRNWGWVRKMGRDIREMATSMAPIPGSADTGSPISATKKPIWPSARPG